MPATTAPAETEQGPPSARKRVTQPPPPPEFAGGLTGPIGLVPCGGGTVAGHPGLPGVTVEIVYATPAMAEAALGVNTGNRPENKRNEAAISRDLKNDRFIYNGQTWVFDKNGRLIDGQNRAKAILATGISAWVTIVRGVEPEAQETQDSGSSRSPVHQIAMRGIGNPQLVQSLARLVFQWLSTTERGPAGASSTKATPGEVLDTVTEHPEIAEAAEYAAAKLKDRRRPVKTNKVALAAAYWWFTMRDKETGKWFLDRFIDGQNIGDTLGGQILELRAVLNRQGDGGDKLDQMTQLWFLILTWNAFQSAKPVRGLEKPKGGYRGPLPTIAGANGLLAIPNGQEPRPVPVPAFRS